MGVLWFVLIGAAAGLLAGVLVKGRGLGLPGSVLIGAVGGVIGGFLFDLLGLGGGGGAMAVIGPLASALLVALILLLLAGLVRRET